MNKISYLIFFFVITLAGCSKAVTEDQIIGSWKTSKFIDSSMMETMIGEPLPSGMTVEATFSATETYHKGNKYNGGGDFSIIYRMNGQEMVLSFNMRISGTWELHDNTIVVTNTDARVTPTNEFARSAVAEDPSMLETFTPVKGESSSVNIISASDDKLETEVDEAGIKIKVTMTKI